MTEPNWQAIAEEYLSTQLGMKALAEKHGVSLYALRKRAAAEDWRQKRGKGRNGGGGPETRARTPAEKSAEQNTDVAAAENAAQNADEAALILKGAALALQWIVGRLESGDVEDYRELGALVRALNGSKSLTRIKADMEEQEQRARIAALEKQTESAVREPLQIEFVNTEAERL